MCRANSILVDAVHKLLALVRNPSWAMELPNRCPPVLWFGNSKSSKPKVLTVGANPSRREFLVSRCRDRSSISYLEPPHNRFRLLCGHETLENILTTETLQEEVIAGFNGYFSGNPYTTWFGNNRDNSYKVEGFLRGFGASYYDGNAVAQQAIHIDLFPFATISDFGRIRAAADAAFFSNGWAQGFLGRLVEFLTPTALIVFGRTNCVSFGRFVDSSISCNPWESDGAGRYFVGRSKLLDLPLVCLTTNLGNPKGFTASTLREYGKRIGQSFHKMANRIYLGVPRTMPTVNQRFNLRS